MDHDKLKFIYTVVYCSLLIVITVISAIALRVNIIRYKDNYIMIFLAMVLVCFVQSLFIRICSYSYHSACRELDKDGEI